MGFPSLVPGHIVELERIKTFNQGEFVVSVD